MFNNKTERNVRVCGTKNEKNRGITSIEKKRTKDIQHLVNDDNLVEAKTEIHVTETEENNNDFFEIEFSPYRKLSPSNQIFHEMSQIYDFPGESEEKDLKKNKAVNVQKETPKSSTHQVQNKVQGDSVLRYPKTAQRVKQLQSSKRLSDIKDERVRKSSTEVLNTSLLEEFYNYEISNIAKGVRKTPQIISTANEKEIEKTVPAKKKKLANKNNQQTKKERVKTVKLATRKKTLSPLPGQAIESVQMITESGYAPVTNYGDVGESPHNLTELNNTIQDQSFNTLDFKEHIKNEPNKCNCRNSAYVRYNLRKYEEVKSPLMSESKVGASFGSNDVILKKSIESSPRTIRSEDIYELATVGSSVEDWFSMNTPGSETGEEDQTHFCLEKFQANILKKLDTSLNEIHNNTRKSLIQMFSAMETAQDKAEKKYEGHRTMILKLADEKFEKLTKRFKDEQKKRKSDFKEMVRNLAIDDQQKRDLIETIKEGIQSALYRNIEMK